MKNKIIYIIIVVIYSTGFFWLGWYFHSTLNNTIHIANPVVSSAELWQNKEPYFSTTDQCHSGNVPEDYACMRRLRNTTLDEANKLAGKFLKASPETSGEQLEGYYDSLHENIQAVQKNADSFVNAYCDLDGMLIYGGTGIMREIEACHYYYAKQYLELLWEIDKAKK